MKRALLFILPTLATLLVLGAGLYLLRSRRPNGMTVDAGEGDVP